MLSLFNYRRFLNRFGTVKNNKKLYNSVLALQNEIVIHHPSSNKVVGVLGIEEELYGVALAKSLAEFYEMHGEKVLLLNVNMHDDIMPVVFNEVEYQVLEKFDAVKFNKDEKIVYKTLGLQEFSSDVLSSEQFGEFMQKAKDHYDHIVLMIPPIGEYRDVLLLKNVIDCAVLTTKRNKTEVSKICEYVNFLKRNAVPLASISFIK